MINVRAIYLGNEAEAYILDDFIDGINIINSDDNHVGKTIVMQSIMFAMGSEAMFPHNFKPKEYVFIIDLDVDGEAISILRSRDTFAIKKRDELVFEESKRDFDESLERQHLCFAFNNQRRKATKSGIAIVQSIILCEPNSKKYFQLNRELLQKG